MPPFFVSALRAICLAPMLAAGPALGLTFDFPGSALIAGTRSDAMTSVLVPTGPWADGALPSRRVEGALDQTAWKIDAPGLSTQQLLAPLRAQLEAAGFAVLWECDTLNCGGFDFRYAIDVLPEPDMHVDLGDFRYLAAERPDSETTEIIGLLVSRSARTGFVQITQIGGDLTEDRPTPAAAVRPPGAPATGLAVALDQKGAMALDDLTFATGSADLGPGAFASLTALAGYLADNPDRKVALVGHTDASGDLAGNVALSKARAASVRDRLIRDYGAAANRVTAEGAGYFAPRSTNLTADGRALNRRVEAVLTSTR